MRTIQGNDSPLYPLCYVPVLSHGFFFSTFIVTAVDNSKYTYSIYFALGLAICSFVRLLCSCVFFIFSVYVIEICCDMLTYA